MAVVRAGFRRLRLATLIASAVAALGGATGVVSSTAQAATASARPCTAANTRIWLGVGHGGAALGTTYYPIEFSNAGRRACTLRGYPGVSAYSENGKELGLPALRVGVGLPTITLRPKATAHAILGVGNAWNVCSEPDTASGLRVYAPNQRSAEMLAFPFGVCAGKRNLTIQPVHAGTGIPGLTVS